MMLRELDKLIAALSIVRDWQRRLGDIAVPINALPTGLTRK
jgi:hypothetical protein